MAPGSLTSGAPEPRKPAAVAPGVPLVAGARLPLAFIGLGLVALAGAVTWSALTPSLFVRSVSDPQVLALVHLWLPGFLLSVCFGAAYQLMPVVLGTPLRGGLGVAWVHFWLHGAGVLGLAAGFAHGRFEIVGAGGALVAVGVLLFGQAVLGTFDVSTRRDAAAWSFPLSAAWLVAAVWFGVLIALNRHWAFLAQPVVALMRAHAHLGLAGFFLTLLQGVAFQLLPMFTMGELRRPRLVLGGFIASQAGLLLLAPGLAYAKPLIAAVGALVLAGGVAASGVAFVATLRSRRRRVLEPGLQAFVLGAALIALAAAAGVFLAVLPAGAMPENAATLYGLLAIGGALGLTVLGMLCKIVPFLVWMRAYGSRVGRQPVPPATSLASHRLERVWLWAHAAALVVIAVAALAASTHLAAAGAWLLAGGVAVFLVNTVRVLSHLWYPRKSPAPNLAATVRASGAAHFSP